MRKYSIFSNYLRLRKPTPEVADLSPQTHPLQSSILWDISMLAGKVAGAIVVVVLAGIMLSGSLHLRRYLDAIIPSRFFSGTGERLRSGGQKLHKHAVDQLATGTEQPADGGASA